MTDRAPLVRRRDQPGSEWCHCADLENITFCERHQVGWCKMCDEGECPECRTERLLAEPDEVDDECD